MPKVTASIEELIARDRRGEAVTPDERQALMFWEECPDCNGVKGEHHEGCDYYAAWTNKKAANGG